MYTWTLIQHSGLPCGRLNPHVINTSTHTVLVELPPVLTVWHNFMSYLAVSMAIKVLYWQLSREENDVLAMTGRENKQQQADGPLPVSHCSPPIR